MNNRTDNQKIMISPAPKMPNGDPISETGYVYVAAFDNGSCKIGMSYRDVKSRFLCHRLAETPAKAVLEWGSPLIANPRQKEKDMIAFMSRHGTLFRGREWFKSSIQDAQACVDFVERTACIATPEIDAALSKHIKEKMTSMLRHVNKFADQIYKPASHPARPISDLYSLSASRDISDWYSEASTESMLVTPLHEMACCDDGVADFFADRGYSPSYLEFLLHAYMTYAPAVSNDINIYEVASLPKQWECGFYDADTKRMVVERFEACVANIYRFISNAAPKAYAIESVFSIDKFLAEYAMCEPSNLVEFMLSVSEERAVRRASK